MSQLTKETAANLVRWMKDREVSPVEVLEAHLAKIQKLNPDLNAIVTLAPEAREQAKAAELTIQRGGRLGALHGLPITIKDTIETKGIRSTSGSTTRADFVPPQDAPAVARLKAAGAIVLGKTNTAEMAMDYTADNPVFGRTNNPYDCKRTPGGSSGGEAVAIATGMSPCGLGSDLAGSIRIPAHFCGVYGLKPTSTSIPAAGQFPPSTGPYSLGAALGPMARSARDLFLLFKVLAGRATELSIEAIREEVRGCDVAWYTSDGVSPITPETRQAEQQAADVLKEAGFKVKEQQPPAIARGHELWLKLFSRASVVQLREVYGGRESEAGPFVRWRLATANDKPPAALDEFIQAWRERDSLREELLAFMKDTPVLIAPVGATTALLHDTIKVDVGGQTINSFRAFSYSQTFNVFDLPSLNVPVGESSEGLPIGVQLVGQPFGEERLLAVASFIEDALGGFRWPPLANGS